MKRGDFFEDVYAVVACIPKGRVTTYGAIAHFLGQKGSARMVGWALNSVHGSKKKIPAHRVINRNGLLTGKHHFGENDRMQKLLEKEGIQVEENKVIHFEKIFWDPSQELETQF